jgi:hypothetical protein
MTVIREGMQDSHMSMYTKFKDEMDTLKRDFRMTDEDAAKIVMYRERTSVIDHRLATISEQLEKLGYLRRY